MIIILYIKYHALTVIKFILERLILKGLEVRIKQHQYNVRQHHTNSAIFQHSFNEDHRINWHNSNKIIKSNNYFERNIIESFLIDCTNNNFNIGKGMFIFDPLIKELLKLDLKNLFKLQ